jgi:cobalt-zinc-cadmium efflux system outer membrane protein
VSLIVRFTFISLFVLVTTGTAATLPPVLTEADAVRLALTSSSVESLNTAELEIAHAEARRESFLANPILDLSRESAGESEHFVTLTQSLDFSGRRSLRRKAAELRTEAARNDIRWRQLDLARLVRSEFNLALTQQELVSGLTRWTQRISKAAQTAQRLEAGGEVSGYDRRRLERERVSAETRLSVEEGALLASRARLAALLGETDLAGVTLQRDESSFSFEDIQPRLLERPDIVAIDRRIEAARAEARAARRWRVPTVDVTGGAKLTESDHGAIFGLGLALPLFHRNQDELLRTDALVVMLTAQREILLARATGEVSGLATEVQRLRGAAQRFREEALPTSERLTATAEAAYQAGEVGILELLDAYRTALEAEAEASQLERRAREIEIELGHAIGENNR